MTELQTNLKCLNGRSKTPLRKFFMLFNWIPSKTMLMLPIAIAKIAILSIMATIAKANGNFSMAIRAS